MEIDAEAHRPLIDAVVLAARELGLAVTEPRVLGAGANVVIDLAPAPIVARVATLTAEMRGGAASYLQRERDVSAALAARGVNVVAPTDLVDPGPHIAGGQAFLLLERRSLQPVDLDSSAHAEVVGKSLVELVTAMADLPAELGVGDEGQPWAEVVTLLETVGPTTTDEAMGRIRTVLESLRQSEPDDAWQLVHGDAHRVNVALSENGVIWYDFEDANRRPLAWDLATLYRSWPAAGEVACRRLDVDLAGPSMHWHHEFREVYALLWNLLYSQRFEHARRPTAVRLEQWLARIDHWL